MIILSRWMASLQCPELGGFIFEAEMVSEPEAAQSDLVLSNRFDDHFKVNPGPDISCEKLFDKTTT
ncbi:MAG TPA: hypothetical protein VN030_05505 [Cellvibrio sp.]|nr:hypothetical protein [Cellvibrio sp.]